jgi:hypothetical protein
MTRASREASDLASDDEGADRYARGMEAVERRLTASAESRHQVESCSQRWSSRFPLAWNTTFIG